MPEAPGRPRVADYRHPFALLIFSHAASSSRIARPSPFATSGCTCLALARNAAAATPRSTGPVRPSVDHGSPSGALLVAPSGGGGGVLRPSPFAMSRMI